MRVGVDLLMIDELDRLLGRRWFDRFCFAGAELAEAGGLTGDRRREYLAGRFPRVLMCERGADLMRRASYANQARVHNGYHYPRSILTALRSRVNFPRFVEEFRPAVDSGLEKVYAIARRTSKVTGRPGLARLDSTASLSRAGAATSDVWPVNPFPWWGPDPGDVRAGFGSDPGRRWRASARRAPPA